MKKYLSAYKLDSESENAVIALSRLRDALPGLTTLYCADSEYRIKILPFLSNHILKAFHECIRNKQFVVMLRIKNTRMFHDLQKTKSKKTLLHKMLRFGHKRFQRLLCGVIRGIERLIHTEDKYNREILEEIKQNNIDASRATDIVIADHHKTKINTSVKLAPSKRKGEFKCLLCNHTSIYKRGMKAHMKKMHLKNETSNVNNTCVLRARECESQPPC